MNRPFNEAHYRALLEGLEASEGRRSTLNDDARIDAEYFKKRYVTEELQIKHHEVFPLGDIAFITDGQHGYHEVDEASPIHMLTAQSARGWFADTNGADTVARWVDDNNKRSSLRDGDLILSTRGTVGLCALVKSQVLPANIDQDVARLHITSKNIIPEYLLAYLNSNYGQDWMVRNQSGMVQQGLSLAKVRALPVPLLARALQQRIGGVIESALRELMHSNDLYTQAETLLLEELGLNNWQPDEPLSYEATSAEAFAAERLDAEYFKPKYTALSAMLQASHATLYKLGDVVQPIRNGFDCRDFIHEGTPYIRVGDVRLGRIDLGGCNRIPLLPADLPKDVGIVAGDVLFTRKGSFGNCAVATTECENAIVSSEIMRLRLASNQIIPEYLALYLNSLAGNLQVGRRVHGVAFYSISQPDLAEVTVCALPLPVQTRLTDAVHQSHAARDESKSLLEKAKRAVEIAIEEGEEAAGEYLDGKAYVQSSALPAMTEQHKYFSLDSLKQYLVEQKLTYEPETVNAYVSRMKREGEIFSAGRGWYSSIAAPLETNPEPVAKLVSDLEARFPLLDFACWSTGQINPWLHHMLGKFVQFVYVDRDAMPSVFDALQELGYQAYLNPTRREAAKSFVVGERTVVIRPSVEKAPVENHIALLEKLLVDLCVELDVFALIDADEFREAAQRMAESRRIELAKLITYARQRKVDWQTIFLAVDAFIAVGDAS